jgi:hypothetical protein
VSCLSVRRSTCDSNNAVRVCIPVVLLSTSRYYDLGAREAHNLSHSGTLHSVVTLTATVIIIQARTFLPRMLPMTASGTVILMVVVVLESAAALLLACHDRADKDRWLPNVIDRNLPIDGRWTFVRDYWCPLQHRSTSEQCTRALCSRTEQPPNPQKACRRSWTRSCGTLPLSLTL